MKGITMDKATIEFPVATGQAAELMKTSERRLGHVLRCDKISPKPPIVAGRRLWSASHLRQAAAVLGALTPDLEALLEHSSTDGSDPWPSPPTATPEAQPAP